MRVSMSNLAPLTDGLSGHYHNGVAGWEDLRTRFLAGQLLCIDQSQYSSPACLPKFLMCHLTIVDEELAYLT